MNQAPVYNPFVQIHKTGVRFCYDTAWVLSCFDMSQGGMETRLRRAAFWSPPLPCAVTQLGTPQRSRAQRRRRCVQTTSRSDARRQISPLALYEHRYPCSGSSFKKPRFPINRTKRRW